MSDDVVVEPALTSVAPASAEPVTAGALLRTAREREGLHIAALAVSMKVPVKKLEALEADRLDLLPDAVFVRALASSVCRALKMDPVPVLLLLPSSAPPRLTGDDRGINKPFNSPSRTGSVTLPNYLTTPSVLIVAVLMVAALAVYFYPDATREMTAAERLYPVTPAAIPDVSTAAVTTPSPLNGPEQASLVIAQPELARASTPTDPTPTEAAPAIPSPLSSVDNNASGAVLSFTAKGLAWVQVTDAKGLQLISRTLQPAETVAIAGSLPLSVVVGRADLTAVELRGKPFDLSAIAQNNVARFEVKP